MITSFLCSTRRIARSNTSSATLIWFSGTSSKVELTTSPLTERSISVTSSGRSSIKRTINSASGWFVVTLCAISFNRLVLPAFGGATIKPRCPNPTGAIKSMMRVGNFFGSVSNFIWRSGYNGVNAGKCTRSFADSGSSPFTASTCNNPK